MLKIISLIVVALVAAVLIFAATKPDTFRVERSIVIKAPPEKVFALVNNFHQWAEWSPWEHLDPAMVRTYGGAAEGKGAVYGWTGDSKVGEGRMEITESSPSTRIGIKLDFLKPFEAHNTTEYTLVAQGDSTTVTWVMAGPNVFMGKLMQVFVNMDNMVGKDFETGLANLKAVAER
ncbi:MAG TPA: SRPBCC family protein [Burkholderiaceae bacterium]|nr:SRPBCC family protein [Burkholderiaceae bacterium]